MLSIDLHINAIIIITTMSETMYEQNRIRFYSLCLVCKMLVIVVGVCKCVNLLVVAAADVAFFQRLFLSS